MRFLLPSFLVLILSLPAGAEGRSGQELERPRIGVALSGGGARGCAHVGVLAELERLRIPVDFIAGTSMGAVVGGIYASGMPIDEIESEMKLVDWDDALSDRTEYRLLDYRRKEDEQRYLLEFQVGWNRGLRWPGGLRSGQKLKFLLQKFTQSAARVEDFDHLSVPFRAVAADIETGDMVVLGSGDLSASLRASMAIPGVFSPVEIDDRLLVDGGIVNNVPVDVLREMGADVVIAVDISEPLASREKLSSHFAITVQMLSLLTRRNMEARLEDADLVITPELEGFGTLDFSNVGTLIERGRQKAKEMEAQLRRWSLPEAEWKARRPSHRGTASPPPVTIEAIRLDGLERTDPRRLRSRIKIEPGEPFDVERVRQDLERLYAIGEFEEASFDLEPGTSPDTRILVLKLVEKSWGPNYLHQNLRLSGDLDGETEFSLLFNLTKTQITARGGEWRTDLVAGAQEGIFTELYLPLDWPGRFFLAPSAGFVQEDLEFFLDSQSTSSFELKTFSAGLDAGFQIGRLGELRLGLTRGRVEAGIEIGDLSFPDTTIQTGGLRALLRLDTLDSPIVPRSGFQLTAQLRAERESLGAEASYERLEATASAFTSFGRHTVALGADAGTNLGSELPFYDEFTVGGLFSLGGYQDGQFSGQRFGVARLIYYYRLFSLPGTFGSSVYAGGVLEGGNAWAEEVDLGDLRYSATAFLVAETIMGPIFFGYGFSDDSSDRFYLTVGRTF